MSETESQLCKLMACVRAVEAQRAALIDLQGGSSSYCQAIGLAIAKLEEAKREIKYAAVELMF